jgi:hypothetical protein
VGRVGSLVFVKGKEEAHGGGIASTSSLGTRWTVVGWDAWAVWLWEEGTYDFEFQSSKANKHVWLGHVTQNFEFLPSPN